MYIAILLVLVIVIMLLIPIKISINYEYYSKDYDINDEDVKREIKIYILRCIRIKKISKKKNKQKNEKNKSNKLMYNTKEVYEKYKELKIKKEAISIDDFRKLKNSIYFQKLNLNIGFNTKKIILNAYIISLFNALFSMYLSKNIDMFNIKNTEYNTYISKNLLRIKLQSIVNINLVNTIFVIIKLIYKFRKGGKNNGKETTSNRKSNANSYDFT